MRELDANNGLLWRLESLKKLVGVGEEVDDGELDAGVPGSILLAETMQTTRRSDWDQLRLEMSSPVGAILDHGELGFRPCSYKQRECRGREGKRGGLGARSGKLGLCPCGEAPGHLDGEGGPDSGAVAIVPFLCT